MTPADLAELRTWAEAHAPCGSVQARQVLDLLARVAELEALTLAQADRIAGQSEALSNRAEKKAEHGECDACGFPNNPDGTCSRSQCYNSE